MSTVVLSLCFDRRRLGPGNIPQPRSLQPLPARTYCSPGVSRESESSAFRMVDSRRGEALTRGTARATLDLVADYANRMPAPRPDSRVATVAGATRAARTRNGDAVTAGARPAEAQPLSVILRRAGGRPALQSAPRARPPARRTGAVQGLADPDAVRYLTVRTARASASRAGLGGKPVRPRLGDDPDRRPRPVARRRRGLRRASLARRRARDIPLLRRHGAWLHGHGQGPPPRRRSPRAVRRSPPPSVRIAAQPRRRRELPATAGVPARTLPSCTQPPGKPLTHSRIPWPNRP